MANTEKTRVTNFLKKLVEIDPNNIREVANHYRQLNEVAKLVEKEMGSLKTILIENQVNEIFMEDEEKVVYQEGRQKSFLDSQKVYKVIGLENFIKIATVTETALKSTNLTVGEVTTVIGQAKVVLEEKASPSIRVAKLSKNELKEMS
jgi:hypothetical protein